MHPTLVRQLRRLCGVESAEELKARLASLGDLALTPEQREFVNGLEEIFNRVDSTYEQNDRDLDLRSRSLEESSSELNAINDRIREELQVRNRVLQSVREAANKLLDQTEQKETPHGEDLESLSSLLLVLIEQQEQRRLRTKRMSEKIVESEKQYRALVEGSRDVIFKMTETGQWAFLNPAWHTITGFTIEESMEQNFIDYVHSDDIDKVFEVYTQITKGTIDHAKFEFRISNKRGVTCWLECTLMREFNELDQIPFFTGTFSDITERRRIAQIQSEFISVVSHELRTPLTSIRGSLGILESGKMGQLLEQQQKLVEIAYKNCQRLSTLVNDILDMEKLNAGKMELKKDRINLIHLIENSIEGNAAYATEYGTSIVLLEKPSTAMVIGDNDRLMQVMANLVSNACKYSPKGKSVELHVKTLDHKYLVQIRDHGPGIPIEFQPRIFSAFAQADSSDTRKQGGTGLGLNITKNLVEKMGGSIGFESEINKGTCFWFELPMA